MFKHLIIHCYFIFGWVVEVLPGIVVLPVPVWTDDFAFIPLLYLVNREVKWPQRLQGHDTLSWRDDPKPPPLYHLFFTVCMRSCGDGISLNEVLYVMAKYLKNQIIYPKDNTPDDLWFTWIKLYKFNLQTLKSSNLMEQAVCASKQGILVQSDSCTLLDDHICYIKWGLQILQLLS